MTDTTKPTPRRTLALALALTGLLALAALPAAAAPADQDRGPDRLALWSLDAQVLWSAFTGWIDSVWDATGAYIDPDGQSLTASATDSSEDLTVSPSRGAWIDPDGAK